MYIAYLYCIQDTKTDTKLTYPEVAPALFGSVLIKKKMSVKKKSPVLRPNLQLKNLKSPVVTWQLCHIY